jgi:putative transposase
MSTGIYNILTGYHNRRSIRLHDYDYTQAGAYYVTICIHDRKQRLFGEIVHGEIIENDHGNIVRNCWNDLPVHYPEIRLDEFVIMPNHVHGIIVIHEMANREPVGAGLKPAPTIRNYIRDNPVTWDLDAENHIDKEIGEME